MAKLPLRLLGLFLLTASISVASCQALVHGLMPLTTTDTTGTHTTDTRTTTHSEPDAG